MWLYGDLVTFHRHGQGLNLLWLGEGLGFRLEAALGGHKGAKGTYEPQTETQD